MSDVKNYALVNSNNIVVNVIGWDGVSAYAIPDGMKLVQSNSVGIGHSYDPVAKTFTNPNLNAILVAVTPSMVVG